MPILILIKPVDIEGRKFVQYFKNGIEVARIETRNQLKTIVNLLKAFGRREDLNAKPYKDGECPHVHSEYIKGEAKCTKCGKVYNEITLEWEAREDE